MDQISMTKCFSGAKTNSKEFLTIHPRQGPLLAYDKYSELVFRINNRVATDQERAQVSKFEAEQPEKCPHCGSLVRRQAPPFRIVHDIANCRRRPS